MVSYLDQIKEYFEGPIDFEGQRKAERYAQLILVSSAVIGFLLGFVLQDLRVTFGLFGTGFVGALFAVVPPWQMYTQNPVTWLPASSSATETSTDTKKDQ